MKIAVFLLALAACGSESPPPATVSTRCTPGEDDRGIHVICLSSAGGDWAALHADPNGTLEIPVGLILDGVELPGAELELHGGFARTVAKKSYRLRLAEDAADVDLFGDGVEAHRRVVLQAAWIDPSFLRNKLAFDLVRAAGGLAPRVTFARVLVDGEPLGFYQVIERIDERFLARHGLATENTNLYKAEGNEANWSDRPDYLTGFDHELGEEQGLPTDDLRQLLQVLNTTPATAEAFAAAVEPRIAVDDLFVYHRVHSFAQNRDAYSKNYYLHHELGGEARFRLISWDADATFCQRWDGVALPPDDTRWHGWDVFSPRLLSIATYREAYVADYLDALDHELAAEGVLASIDALAALIAPHARADLARWQPELDFDGEIARLRDCVPRRVEVMRAALAPLAPAAPRLR